MNIDEKLGEKMQKMNDLLFKQSSKKMTERTFFTNTRKFEELKGWLVGLGMVKGIDSTYPDNRRNDIKEALLNFKNSDYPYGQGIKEALEWCLK